jgi:hypothetical protein
MNNLSNSSKIFQYVRDETARSWTALTPDAAEKAAAAADQPTPGMGEDVDTGDPVDDTCLDGDNSD